MKQTLKINQASFGNDDGDGVIERPYTDSGLEHGQVLFANDSLFSEAYYSEPLTNYLVGWRDPDDILGTLNFFAPPVQVGRRFEYKAMINAEEFESETTDDIRAINADFKTVVYSGKDVLGITLNKGLSYVQDLDKVSPNDTQWQNRIVMKLQRRLYRNELRRAVAGISAAATNTAVTWDTTAGKNPDQDILTALLAAKTASGIRPNRVIFGDMAWNKRRLSYAAQTGSVAYALQYQFSPDQLAPWLEVDKVKVSRERYQTAFASKSEVVGSYVYAWFANDGIDTEDASNIKRFVTPFSPEQGGGMLRVYVQQKSSKLVVISVEHYSNVIITYAGGIEKLSVS